MRLHAGAVNLTSVRSIIALSIVLSVAGCGSSHQRGADAGARADAAVSRDAAEALDAGPPDECRVDTTAAPPYSAVFRLENDTADALFIGEDCHERLTVSACASGYAPLSLHADCTSPCPLAPGTGCIACGACMTRGVAVAPGATLDVAFSGVTYTFDTTMACGCSNAMNAPAGRYRIEVPIYADELSAETGGTALRTVRLDFELPAPDGIVTVPLGG